MARAAGMTSHQKLSSANTGTDLSHVVPSMTEAYFQLHAPLATLQSAYVLPANWYALAVRVALLLCCRR